MVRTKRIPLVEYLSRVPDRRRQCANLRHPLVSVLVLALCGILCGAKSFRGIEAFCRRNEKFYCEWLDLPHGIPSHDTFARVFQVVDPEELIGALTEWLLDLRARRGRAIGRWWR